MKTKKKVNDEEASNEGDIFFNCDECDFNCKCEVKFKKHMNSKHVANPKQKAVTKQSIII